MSGWATEIYIHRWPRDEDHTALDCPCGPTIEWGSVMSLVTHKAWAVATRAAETLDEP